MYFIFKVLTSTGIEFKLLHEENIWIAKAKAQAFGNILDYKRGMFW